MKQLFSLFLAAFFVLGALLSRDALAQTLPETLMKDYCNSVKVGGGFNSATSSLALGKISAPNSGDPKVLIKGVKISGSGVNESFTANQSFSPFQMANGASLYLPSIKQLLERIKREITGEKKLDVQLENSVTYYKSADDPSKPNIPQTVNCTTVTAQAITVQPQAQQQPPASPAGGGNIGAPGPGAPRTGQGPEYCDPPANTRISTAIGCIPVNDPHAFAGWFLGWAIGVAGGIALLLIIFSGFQIMTAAGDPQKLQSGRELLTAAVSGLILIIFSIFLLRLIGVQILHIPGII